jgi:chemotaxis protein CheZ
MPLTAGADPMPLPPAHMPLSEADYEAIEAAVVETNRGRWFLAEYARRNRHADTKMLLTAIDRLEAAIRGERAAESVDRIRFDLVEMAKAITRTKAEIAAIKADVEQAGKFGEATEELDSIVSATEAATSDILAAAEQVQEVAWTLREQGLDPEVCDLLDAKATAIYTACSFQDLTGQRTGKVIQVLRYLEGRINAMIDIWGIDGTMAAEAAATAQARADEAARMSRSARPGDGLDQADIDMVMGPAAGAAPAHQGEILDVTPERPVAKPTAPPAPASDPLAPLNALTPEEKIALFS